MGVLIQVWVGAALLFYVLIAVFLSSLSALDTSKSRATEDSTSVTTLAAAPILETDVTLLVKTFARPGCLHRLLRTVRARYHLMAILVADDSRSPSISNYSGVEIFHLSWQSGCSFGKNMLIQHVKTPYVIFMDDDMYPSPELDLLKWVERVRELQVDLVSASVQDATYGLLGVQEFIRRGENLFVLHNNISSLSPWRGRCISVNYALQIFAARTKLLREISWDSALKTAEHDDFMLSLSKANKRLATCTDLLVMHSRTDGCVGTPEHERERRNVEPYLRYTMQKWNLTRISYLAERYVLTEQVPGNFMIKIFYEHFRDVQASCEQEQLAAKALALYNAPRLGWYQRVLHTDTPILSVQMRPYNLISEEAIVQINTRWHRPKSDRTVNGDGAKRITVKMRYVLSDTALFYTFCHISAVLPLPSSSASPPVIYIVTAVYNVKEAFLRSLDQLKSAAATGLRLHWVVVDHESVDLDIAEELHATSSLPSTFVSGPPPFCRSSALNAGVAAISEPDPLVFILDAAMEYSDELLRKAPLYVQRGYTAWFPLYYGADVNYWIHYGFGALAFYRSDFVRIGKFDQETWGCRYGGEDMDIAGRFAASGLSVWRTEERLVHYSHPRQQGYFENRNTWNPSASAPPLLITTRKLRPSVQVQDVLSERAGMDLRSNTEFYFTPRVNRTDVLHVLTADKTQLLFECQAKDALLEFGESD